jgi:peroxiredoxin
MCAATPVAPAFAATPASSAKEPPPLPAFEGRTLDGKPLATSAFAGKRLVLFCFNPGLEQSEAYAKALAKVVPEQTRHNFAVVGVAMGLDPAKARAFASRHKLAFPIFDDSDGSIAQTLTLQTPIMLVGSDADRRVGLALVTTQSEEALPAATIEARVRDYLRIPVAGAAEAGKLDEQPKAPLFEAKRLEGGDPFRLADLSGKPVVLVFFQPACSHCQEALRFFKNEFARMSEDIRPALVGVAGDSRPYAVESALKEKQLDFFPVLLDPEREVATAYGSFGHVPDIVMIDAAGKIAYRTMGWDAKHDPDLMRMRMARIAGRTVPMLVARAGFTGNDACAVCHPMQAATWRFTEHASAFETLVARGADRDPKCVGCHVVGFGKSGGFSEVAREKHFEDVGCESCHGRGGGHLEGEKKAASGDFRAACLTCHDQEHSLGFDYATFLPKVSHAVVASMSDADRARRIADRGKPRDLLPKSSAYAGSEACKSCHAHEYGIWSKSSHAHAVDSLRTKSKEGDDKCITCHVTGYGRTGGFPAHAEPSAHADLARVGCESCHGPGAEHVKAGGKQAAGVVKLGDKCDSCVILQICGSCHDDANDPGFRFEVEAKIEKIRHGSASPVAAH